MKTKTLPHMNNKMSPVVHFEMPAVDKQRMADFYSKTFGWQTQMLGPEMGGYVLAGTCELGENGFPKQPGMINGGFFEKTPDNQYPSIVISVDDIHEAIQKVRSGGGRILPGQNGNEVDEIPGIGQFVSIIDTEGNRVGVLQPKPM